MTHEAVTAATAFHAHLVELGSTLEEAQWLAPSACAGWRVRDVFAHLGATARNAVDPIPLPAERLPLPDRRERQHDVHVDVRRAWSIDEVTDELATSGTAFLGVLASLQDEPTASAEMTVPGLGTYPMHALAHGIAFDFHCHLVHDLLGPAGPIDRSAPAVTHEQLRPVVQWMMWGLPQMQGPELDDSLVVPITFRFTGPGESTWTVERPDPSGGLVVTEADGGEVTVTSTAADFVGWGTGRSPWRDACHVDGPVRDVAAFLSTLNIV